MSFVSAIPLIGKAVDIIDQVVEDKDKKNEILAALGQAKEATYALELRTKTVPWIDGLHKMGRQILNLLTLIAVVVLIALGHEITQWDVLLLGGSNTAYQIIKGRGR